MNSCIYKIKIGHKRLMPIKNVFSYSIYMLYFDLDEIEEVSNNCLFFSYNKANLLSFFDADHFKFLNKISDTKDIIAKENINYDKNNYKDKNTKERIIRLAKDLGIKDEIEKVFILTNARNLGYIFNPVSFYYCYTKEGEFKILFSEVNNTFGDQKMYYTVIDNPEDGQFSSQQRKNYYISPFINYDNDLHWNFREPGEDIFMAIDSLKEGKPELKTVLNGRREEISKYKFLSIFLRYPMIPLVAIFLIHYQALKLWIKKVNFFRKEETDKNIAEAIKNK